MAVKPEIKVAASLACADFWRLEEQVKMLEQAKVEILHCDVMDGIFVPNFSLFPDIIVTLKKNTLIPIEVHMQIINPDQYAEVFINAGADIICFHIESLHCVNRLIWDIKSKGAKVGIALNPSTHPSQVEFTLPYIDYLTIMAVDPGFYGQKFIGEVIGKIKYLRGIIEQKGYPVEIEVDGNMNVENARKCIAAGANIIVAGTSSIFRKTGNLEINAKQFKEALL